jgi:hypothetical protein
MKLAAIALTLRSRSRALAHLPTRSETTRTSRPHPMYRDAGPSVVSHPKHGDPYGHFSGTGNTDVWGQLGARFPQPPAAGETADVEQDRNRL